MQTELISKITIEKKDQAYMSQYRMNERLVDDFICKHGILIGL